MKNVRKIFVVMLLAAFAFGISGCAAGKCGCPKVEILE